MLSYQEMWDMPLSAQSAGREGKEAGHIPHLAGNIIYGALFAVFKAAFRFSVHGIEHVRTFSDGRGCVVAGNHASYLDPVFLWLAARPQQWIRFMARDNMFSNAKGIAGQVISRVGAFPVKRGSADRAAIKRASSMLKRGEIVGIFPEGTRRGRGTAAPDLHAGVAFIARMGKAPIVPSSVRGVEKIKPAGSRFLHFPKIEVCFGAPVFLEDFDFLPKEDRLDGASWYVMSECYALSRGVSREQIDMKELFPEAKDFASVFAGRDMSRKGA
ncbi:MAG: 1-acyl-sn-glycerol-3-phosphate acyltransferase [Slackia piriformis]|uniref:1-acyl-sn-glycerol-3-phosphate acyltransferase n=1 Tax=Slackia piriformis TaxID=626934 RepID=A0A943Z7A3_9ACTN|nr:1-acyl-sn-glycerol-3-phosphate acyltransferase [Slackia piriformis]